MRLRPALLDLTLYQGASFALTLRLVDRATRAPLDPGPRTGRMQIRATPEGAVLAELSTANGGVTLGPAPGVITLALPAAATAALSLPQGGVYDLLLTDAEGEADRLLMGRVTLDPAVTR